VISDLSNLYLMMALGAPMFLLVMLLPTLMELKRPRDAGPRFVMPGLHPEFLLKREKQLADIECHNELEILLVPLVGRVVDFLPDLDTVKEII
jgi:hypothetical protein